MKETKNKLAFSDKRYIYMRSTTLDQVISEIKNIIPKYTGVYNTRKCKDIYSTYKNTCLSVNQYTSEHAKAINRVDDDKINAFEKWINGFKLNKSVESMDYFANKFEELQLITNDALGCVLKRIEYKQKCSFVYHNSDTGHDIAIVRAYFNYIYLKKLLQMVNDKYTSFKNSIIAERLKEDSAISNADSIIEKPLKFSYANALKEKKNI